MMSNQASVKASSRNEFRELGLAVALLLVLLVSVI
jgi:hypothetical protein